MTELKIAASSIRDLAGDDNSDGSIRGKTVAVMCLIIANAL